MPVPSVGGQATSTNAAFPPDVPVWSLWAELVVNVLWFAVIRVGRRWMPLLSGSAMLALVVILAAGISGLNHGWENSVGTRRVGGPLTGVLAKVERRLSGHQSERPNR